MVPGGACEWGGPGWYPETPAAAGGGAADTDMGGVAGGSVFGGVGEVEYGRKNPLGLDEGDGVEVEVVPADEAGTGVTAEVA